MKKIKKKFVCLFLAGWMSASASGGAFAQSGTTGSSLPGFGGAPKENAPPQQKKYRTAADGTPILPMIFPVLGKVFWVDSFAPNGEGGRRQHHGQDLIAPKMRPLVAAFDGRIFFHRASPGGHNILSLDGDNGCSCTYMHINNDTPGTNDGLGSEDYAFPASLKSGDRVIAGQLIAWVGNSGNAEAVCPHCHFEMWFENRCINPLYSLRNAQKISVPRVNLAFPEIRPASDEVRLDGVVRTADASSGIAVIDLAAVTRPAGIGESIIAPVRRWLDFKTAVPDKRIASERTAMPAELTPGAAVIVLGAEQGKGKALRVHWSKIVPAAQPQPTYSTLARRGSSTTFFPSARPDFLPKPQLPQEDEEVFDDFENGTYEGWTLEGCCWGKGPASDALFPGRIYGYRGDYFACTLDARMGTYATGKATSRKFQIRHQYLSFYIGGGRHPHEACLNLVVDGRVVATATGDDTPELNPKRWDISAFQGKTAHLEIIDTTLSPQRGYIMVDRIAFRRKLPVR